MAKDLEEALVNIEAKLGGAEKPHMDLGGHLDYIEDLLGESSGSKLPKLEEGTEGKVPTVSDDLSGFEYKEKADLVSGKVPASQLPSYVDDVLEYDDLEHFPSTGEEGKIYVALDTGFTYRWSGSEYVQIGGQDLSNFVTLDTDQTITGVKTFNKNISAPNTFNVINASDIVNNTLTQEQYDLITNGKPTLIKGELGNYKDLLFASGVVYGNSFRGIAICSAKAGGFGQNILLKILINETTKVISTGPKYTTFNYDGGLGVIGLDTINGKSIPVYPSDTGTFNLKQLNGALTWTEEWYGTQAEYDALGTYNDNTIYNITEE